MTTDELGSVAKPEVSAPGYGHMVQLPRFDNFGGSGIYFLFDQGEVVYVGQAVKVRRRIADHIGEGVKRFDSFVAVPCEARSLLTVEKRLIRALLPRYNKCSLTESIRAASLEEIDRSVPPPASFEPMKVEQAAAYLGIAPAALRSLWTTGEGPRPRRFSRSRLTAFSPIDLYAYRVRHRGKLDLLACA